MFNSNHPHLQPSVANELSPVEVAQAEEIEKQELLLNIEKNWNQFLEAIS